MYIQYLQHTKCDCDFHASVCEANQYMQLKRMEQHFLLLVILSQYSATMAVSTTKHEEFVAVHFKVHDLRTVTHLTQNTIV